jgi:hypothetical protein
MENNMSKKRNAFAVRFWAILGFVGGCIITGGVVLERGCSILLSILCAIGGGLAGAILLTALMALNYVMYRMDIFDIFSKKE